MRYGFAMTITLKNVSPSLHRYWKERAERNGRSLNKELLYSLEQFNARASVEDNLAESKRLRGLEGACADDSTPEITSSQVSA